jgi:O-antigen biosynthesis protein
MTHTFSIITPVYEPPVDVLVATIESVLAQSYPHWELCLVDDASPSATAWPVLERYAASDHRIRVARRAENGGISRASNDALALATGEFVAFLDHDDRIVPEALEVVNRELVEHAPVDFAYSDEAQLMPDGHLRLPFYKPDWSPERMRSQMFTGHLGVMRRALVAELGGFRPEFDGAQDYDLVLRLTERTDRIRHIPAVLYLWRAIAGSAAAEGDAKPWAIESGRRAVQEHCERVGIDAVVEMLPEFGCHRVRRQVHGAPLVSIVIPTRGSVATVHGEARVHVVHAVASVLERSTYADVEFVVVADQATPEHVLGELERLAGDRLRVVRSDGPFNFAAKMNTGVAASTGEVLILLNDDVEVITPDWIEVLVGLVQEPDCGMVGCKLLYADDTLQHGGHVYLGGNAAHAYTGYAHDEPGMANMLRIERECSGVTAACAALRRDVWEQAGGMCELLPVNFNDVDLSLKLRHLGYRIVWTPHAVLHHFESLTRNAEVANWERDFIFARWFDVLHADPYFNPNLDPGRTDWVVLQPPELVETRPALAL